MDSVLQEVFDFVKSFSDIRVRQVTANVYELVNSEGFSPDGDRSKCFFPVRVLILKSSSDLEMQLQCLDETLENVTALPIKANRTYSIAIKHIDLLSRHGLPQHTSLYIPPTC